jgi:hypothetical protein
MTKHSIQSLYLSNLGADTSFSSQDDEGRQFSSESTSITLATSLNITFLWTSGDPRVGPYGYNFNLKDAAFRYWVGQIFAFQIAGYYREQEQRSIFPAYNMTAISSHVVAYNETFFLDTTQLLLHPAFHSYVAASQSGPEIVPYNSTLWYNGTSLQLSAPFLRFDQTCSWFNDPLGVCMCLKDTPIYTDWRADSSGGNFKCINDSNSYIWGFASFISIIGLYMEIIWIFGCWLIWAEATRCSNLVNANRPGTGTIRNIIDISGAIRKDLGDHTSLYNESLLREELDRCPQVGYVVEKGMASDTLNCLPYRRVQGPRVGPS